MKTVLPFGFVLTRHMFKSQSVQCPRCTGLKFQSGEGMLCVRASLDRLLGERERAYVEF